MTKNKNKKDISSKNKNENNNFQWKQAGRTSFIWILIFISAILLSNLFSSRSRGEKKIQFFEYKEFLYSGIISEAEIIGNEFHGKLSEPQEIFNGDQKVSEYSKFLVTLPFIDDSVLSEWDEYNLKYSFQEKKVDWTSYLLSMAPWLLLIVFWLFIMRRMQGGMGGGIFNFGKSKARLWVEDKPKINFKKVAGCEEAKFELSEIITFLKNPKKFQKLGGRIPKGVLLLGPPGTGKTLLAKAVAGEAKVPFFSLSGADFVEMFVGVGASRVRDLFEQGKKNAPSIIFIDEIDAVGRHRGAGLGGGHDEREQTLNALLVEMDGFESTTNIILIAATNRADVLDSALLRPGRFDRQVVVDIPDIKGRKGILEVHTQDIPLSKDVDLEIVAKGTPGLVGADLENLVNEASLLAARDGKTKVFMEDLESAKDKVMMGVERKSMILSDEEKELTAYHEAGHALIAKILPKADPVHKVSIIPRGRALGVTAQLPMDEKHNYSESYINARLRVLLAGRAAEELIFNEVTTGAGNDIEVGTDMVRKMVCEWGMSRLIGPLKYGQKDQEVFLGRDIAKNRDYSDETAKRIDEEIHRIIKEAEDDTNKILKENENILHAIAKALLKFETIDGKDLDQIFLGKQIIRKTDKKKHVSKSSKVKNLKSKNKNIELN